MKVDPVRRFTEIVARPEGEIDLGEAALVIAAAGDPGIDVSSWLGELDALAAGVHGFDGLRRRLFGELGFTGDAGDYYDPANSFLHRVISRRRGIPITLSVLAMEVGRRAGVPLEGIGMPAHFLVRHPASGAYLDAFRGGALLDEAGCEAAFREATGAGPEVPFGPHLLPQATSREILARMLANLKGIYRARGAGARLEWVQRMRLALPEVPREEVVDLGEALAMQGRPLDGAEAIEAAAHASPALASPLRAAARALRASMN